jgi:hypothetical protein
MPCAAFGVTDRCANLLRRDCSTSAWTPGVRRRLAEQRWLHAGKQQRAGQLQTRLQGLRAMPRGAWPQGCAPEVSQRGRLVHHGLMCTGAAGGGSPKGVMAHLARRASFGLLAMISWVGAVNLLCLREKEQTRETQTCYVRCAPRCRVTKNVMRATGSPAATSSWTPPSSRGCDASL